MKLAITIQDQLVETINAAYSRWSHLRAPQYGYPGHAGRTIHVARRRAKAELAELGYTPQQAEQFIRDCMDIAELERIAVCE